MNETFLCGKHPARNQNLGLKQKKEAYMLDNLANTLKMRLAQEFSRLRIGVSVGVYDEGKFALEIAWEHEETCGNCVYTALDCVDKVSREVLRGETNILHRSSFEFSGPKTVSAMIAYYLASEE